MSRISAELNESRVFSSLSDINLTAAIDSAKPMQGKSKRRKGEKDQKNLASLAEVKATAEVDKAKRTGTSNTLGRGKRRKANTKTHSPFLHVTSE